MPMKFENFPNNPVSPKPTFAQSIFDGLSGLEADREMPRVSAIRLSGGKDATLNLSVKERLGREGWNLDNLIATPVHGVVTNRSGETFEVLEIKKGVIKIKNSETGMVGEIIAQPRNLKVHEYAYNLQNSSKNSRKIKVFDAAYKDRSLDTSDFIDNLVGAIPTQCMDVFDEIQIHSQDATAAGIFRAEQSLFSERRILSLYVNPDAYTLESVRETLYHELGHAIAKFIKGKVNPGNKWKEVMQLDGNQVSEYASKTRYSNLSDNGEIEDFADSVMMYLSTDGAKTSKTESLRNFCKNRFKKLDEIFAELSTRQKSSVVANLARSLSTSEKSL